MSGPAYARSRTRFYVQGGGVLAGGKTVGSFSTQFFALDLTKPWSVYSPTWIELSSEGPSATQHNSVISLDGKHILASGTMSTFGFLYNIENDTWVPSTVIVPEPSRPGIMPVQNMDTGLVYFAGGYGGMTDTTMPIYNFTTDSLMP
ncbi:hypothetical protein BGZ65_011833, partial [Modicella reniformis]